MDRARTYKVQTFCASFVFHSLNDTTSTSLRIFRGHFYVDHVHKYFVLSKCANVARRSNILNSRSPQFSPRKKEKVEVEKKRISVCDLRWRSLDKRD